MQFLFSQPFTHVHFFRIQDWRCQAEPTSAMRWRAALDGDALPGATPRLTLDFEGAAPSGGGTFLFAFPALAKDTAPAITSDSPEWNWQWPVLEVRTPCTRLEIADFPLPALPGRLYLENYCRLPDGRILRAPEAVVNVEDTPAASVQAYLSSNFEGGLLRYSVVAEQDDAHHWMPDRNYNGPAEVRLGQQTLAVQLRHGIAQGAIPLPSRSGFAAEVTSGALDGVGNWVDPAFTDGLPYSIFWGDIHVHSRESDGEGDPETVVSRARDWLHLDFMAFNEHIENSLAWRPWNADKWKRLRAVYETATQNGSFVIIPGFEFRSYCNLWCFNDEYTDFISVAETLDNAHYPKGKDDPVYPQQQADAQRRIAEFAARPGWLVGYHRLENLHATLGYMPTPVQYLQMAHYKRPPETGSDEYLLRGDRVGFFGSTDTHIGLPGLPFKPDRTAQSGLTAIYAERLDRDSLHEALLQRRTYATMGSRTLLDFRLNGALMGSVLALPDGAPIEITVRAAGRERLAGLEIVSGGQDIAHLDCDGTAVEHTFRFTRKGPGEQYFFARVHLADGRMAWNSPVYVTEP